MQSLYVRCPLHVRIVRIHLVNNVDSKQMFTVHKQGLRK